MWFVPGTQSYFAQTSTDTRSNASKQVASAGHGCLPDDIKPETVVEAKQIKWRGGIRIVKETVSQRLKNMSARCKAGRLVDAKGKGIRFYQVEGCWGNPPADYQEILDRQRAQLEALRKRFTVVELTCNPTGVMPF